MPFREKPDPPQAVRRIPKAFGFSPKGPPSHAPALSGSALPSIEPERRKKISYRGSERLLEKTPFFIAGETRPEYFRIPQPFFGVPRTPERTPFRRFRKEGFPFRQHGNAKGLFPETP